MGSQVENFSNVSQLDILGPLFFSRAQSVHHIRQLGPSQDIINGFARLAGISGLCTTIEEYEQGTYRLLFNSVTGLIKEETGRLSILETIRLDVIKGNQEIAILETDMDNLKGINDLYTPAEADKAIRAYADSIKTSLLESIAQSGNNIKFAVINKHGEGSDSIKVVLVGSDIYRFTRSYVDGRTVAQTVVQLHRKTDRESEEVKVKGGWGFYIMKRDEIQRFVAPNKEELDNAGDLYNFVSDLASVKMEEDKVRLEAELAHRVLMARSLDDLLALETEINGLGSRVSNIIHQHLFHRLKDLLGKK